MGFSFNWQGLTVPQASKESNSSYQARARSDAAALGNAARGYLNRKGQQEYADMIANAQQSEDPRIAAIEAEISRLEARNRELEQLQAASQQAQPQPGFGTFQTGAFQTGVQNPGFQATNLFPMINTQQYQTR